MSELLIIIGSTRARPGCRYRRPAGGQGRQAHQAFEVEVAAAQA